MFPNILISQSHSWMLSILYFTMRWQIQFNVCAWMFHFLVFKCSSHEAWFSTYPFYSLFFSKHSKLNLQISQSEIMLIEMVFSVDRHTFSNQCWVYDQTKISINLLLFLRFFLFNWKSSLRDFLKPNSLIVKWIKKNAAHRNELNPSFHLITFLFMQRANAFFSNPKGLSWYGKRLKNEMNRL